MYSENIAYVNEVQVKNCERIKFDSVKIDSEFPQQTKQNLEAQYFLSGTGYTSSYEYLISELQGYTFYLNEYADLKCLIPKDQLQT